MRIATITAALLAWAMTAPATTLQKLTTGDMIRQSTSIVRATVTGTYTTQRGSDIYTHYQLQITETLKAGPSGISEVAVPGGTINGLRQLAAGAPGLTKGQDYVIFLWTGRSGMTQVIGLSQGLFTVMQNDAGETVLVRGPIDSFMLDRAGRIVSDQGITMKLSDLRTQIQKAAGR
ncbi:MAG: hypothetical protein LAO79_24810 [Acidobacteriia bacterium]|nr:hypothetical protein [Terriglobia bacterium]